MKTIILIGVIVGLFGCDGQSVDTQQSEVTSRDAATDTFTASLPKDAGCYYVDEYVFGGPDAGNHPSIFCP